MKSFSEVIEEKFLSLKKDGKYYQEFITMFGSTKFWAMSDEMLNSISDYLTNKGF